MIVTDLLSFILSSTAVPSSIAQPFRQYALNYVIIASACLSVCIHLSIVTSELILIASIAPYSGGHGCQQYIRLVQFISNRHHTLIQT
ncbi:hypothetical protein WR25_14972 [Diploscapter pachys]|uniref:7TM GPCR serpentine receptor class x (Srx) domain-containing protein n=1 Tax=Diploscapter pachys TaxID=2018661 RepID=A0A2A2LSM6_9BILA|nr:hypothetical protein WR25_14972 [Diploscapter pachys]